MQLLQYYTQSTKLKTVHKDHLNFYIILLFNYLFIYLILFYYFKECMQSYLLVLTIDTIRIYLQLQMTEHSFPST